MPPNANADHRADDRWTIKRLLDWTSQFFSEHGADQPRLDAEILLAEALGCQRIDLYTRFDETPEVSQRDQFREWVRRHGGGEPVAYLVGHREFFSLRFDVNPDVLIPRPETEHLVTEALDLIQQMSQPGKTLRLADVGTGCGNIAIAIALHASKAQIVALDCSQPALAVAKSNAARHQITPERIRFVHSNWFDELDHADEFDIIVSNPPYIGLQEKNDLDKSVVDYEPHSALFSTGPDGTESIQKLIQESERRLRPQGYLLFEISPMIQTACEQLIQQSSVLKLQRVVKDLAGLPRIVVAQRGN